MNEVREYSYKILGLNGVEAPVIEQIKKDFSSINGVIAINVNKEEEIIDYVLDQWSSDYDAFSKLSEICDKFGLELVFDEDEIIENEVEEEEQPAAEDFEVESHPIEIKHKLTKADFAEKVIIMLLAIGFLITGSLLTKYPNVQPWILLIGFTIASYEILYDVIAKATEKIYVIEELLTFLGALILTYQGKMVTSAVIMMIYSCLSFTVAYSKHKVALEKESIMQKIEKCNDEKQKEILTKKLEFINANENASSKDTYKLAQKRKIFSLFTFVLAILIVFLPPFFTIKTYWATLSSKWLYLGACILILNGIGEMLYSLSHAEFNALYNAYKNDVEISSVDKFLALSTKSKVCFDKSGVLVKDCQVEKVDGDEKTLLYAFSTLNGLNDHVSKAITVFANDITALEVSNLEQLNGGYSCNINGCKVLIGSKRLFKDNSITVEVEKDNKSHLFVAVDGKQIGYITLSFDVYKDSYGAVAEIKHDLGLKTEIISADDGDVVTELKKEIKADHALAGASSKFKADRVNKENAVYVGNEANDGQTLDLVDCAITFGNSGDISIKKQSIRKVPLILKLATRTAKTLKLNRGLIVATKLLLVACAVFLRIFTTIDFIWWIFAIDVLVRGFTVINSILNSSDVA